MNHKINFLILIFSFLSFESISQAKIDFQISEHDFGNVTEGTLASHDFTFTNTGTEPLLINNVKASCGCTTPYWTKEPIMPGKQGKITASYDSNNRPGAFNKSITVTSNAQEPSKTLMVKGVVISKSNVEKIFTDKEIAESPKVNIDKNVVRLGKVEKSQHIPFTIGVRNNGKTDLSISQVKSNCNCLKLENSKVVKPGQSEAISIIFTAGVIGQRKEPMTLYTNDITNPETQIVLEAEVVESLGNKNMLKEKSSTLTF
ncbi:MAG: DUF1573 domain-containing protein [Bacteroidota bacterium]|nr:DUF1573 domain-containing protein [Bacteroidota bacterium]